MQMQAVLKDDALIALLTFITTHKSDEVAPVPMMADPLLGAGGGGRVVGGGDTKEWLNKHSASEILNAIKWDTNPEKILLMGAFHESKVESNSWRSADIESRFSEAKETQPSNFARDISKAIKAGIVTPVTPRTYTVSRTGWNKIAEAIAKLPTT
jgi:hypothetical protein